MSTSPITEFTNQVAVITGGSSGLGLSIMKALLAEGAKVAVLDLKAHPDTEKDSNVYFQSIDITQEDKVREAINIIGNKFGRIDILVNSAGIADNKNIRQISRIPVNN